MKNYKQSLHYATTSKALNSAGEEWVKPFACNYAARACVKLSEVKEMKKWIGEAESYSDYDYHKHLKNLLFALSTDE